MWFSWIIHQADMKIYYYFSIYVQNTNPSNFLEGQKNQSFFSCLNQVWKLFPSYRHFLDFKYINYRPNSSDFHKKVLISHITHTLWIWNGKRKISQEISYILMLHSLMKIVLREILIALIFLRACLAVRIALSTVFPKCSENRTLRAKRPQL